MVDGFSRLNIFAKSSILDVSLSFEYASELPNIFPNYNNQSTNVLNQKINVFFDEEIFCLHWIARLKNAWRGEVVKNFKKIGRQSSKLKHSLK